MTTTLRGDDLAYATLDYIREHPEEWDQKAYFCGSSACFAGRAIILATGGAITQVKAENPRSHYDECFGSAGIMARDLLGWTNHQAWRVFYTFTNDFTKLEELVKGVLNGEIE